GWQSPAGTSLKQPQIATMKEKPSHHPEREIGSANSQLHQRFTVDTEGTRERARYHWKDLDPSFSDHLSDRQFDRIAIPSYLLRVMLVFVRGVGAVYVCDQSGDEANLINQMVSDRSKTGGYGYRTSRATFLLEGLKNFRSCCDRAIKGYSVLLRFFRTRGKGEGLFLMSRDYVSGRGSRDVWTSDAALVGGGSETSGLATQLVWGVGAETFAFDAALEGGGTETYCTSDAAYASCLFMLELNFHSGSSITQMRLTSRSDCYWAERGSVPALTRDGDLLGRGFDSAWLFCKLVGIAFGWGCDSLRCVILELRLGWQSPAGTSLKQPQIATMKEKPSHHPEREIGSANSQLHQRFTIDTEGTRERARYHWKDLDPSFSDHLSDRQFDRIAIPSYLLRVMLVFVRGVGAVYVCDQSGDEANLINQMVSDRSKTGGYGYRTSRATFLLEGLKNFRSCCDRAIKGYSVLLRFFRTRGKGEGLFLMSRDYVSGRGSRDVWTSDAALVGGGSETSGLATQLVWGVGAETFAFDAALEGGGTETYCTSDAAYASCLFMLELNFHSGSSITQMRLTSRSDCYWAGALGVLSL
ncbi:hypothetical protein IGI04_019299, partial [Brassica rapa subsp. trilocularis]